MLDDGGTGASGVLMGVRGVETLIPVLGTQAFGLPCSWSMGHDNVFGKDG